MQTAAIRVPEPGEVWFKKSHWGACFIRPDGMVAVNQGDEQFPALMCEIGMTGNRSHQGGVPVLLELDGWTAYDSYADFIEHRRCVMVANLEATIREVNEVCNREIARGKPWP